MINLVNKQNAMPEQAPDIRNKNFLEVIEVSKKSVYWFFGARFSNAI